MFTETVRQAFQAIIRNAMRSFLTILGVIIGVAAVITMVTIGQGSTDQIESDVSKLGHQPADRAPGRRDGAALVGPVGAALHPQGRGGDQGTDPGRDRGDARQHLVDDGDLRQREPPGDHHRRRQRLPDRARLERGAGTRILRKRTARGYRHLHPGRNRAQGPVRRRRPGRRNDPHGADFLPRDRRSGSERRVELRPGPGRHGADPDPHLPAADRRQPGHFVDVCGGGNRLFDGKGAVGDRTAAARAAPDFQPARKTISPSWTPRRSPPC